jgi:hypothetical protein
MWFISKLKPKIFVELGTHNGYSYFAFAQSASINNINVKMYAIDTWQGDEHAGFYGDEVFRSVDEINKTRYSSFSYLLRNTFDEGLAHFQDQSIDVLHIDGLHTYEAVKHDFETWLPKMSEQGIVLFHDISVRERGFGVFQLWEELSSRYPSFEFIHGNGLGILKVGKLETSVDFLLESTSEEVGDVQRMYSTLGRRMSNEYELDVYKIHARALETRAQSELASAQSELASAQSELASAQSELASAQSELAIAQSELASKLPQQMSNAIRIVELESELNEIQASSSWRLTKPLRRLHSLLTR